MFVRSRIVISLIMTVVSRIMNSFTILTGSPTGYCQAKTLSYPSLSFLDLNFWSGYLHDCLFLSVNLQGSHCPSISVHATHLAEMNGNAVRLAPSRQFITLIMYRHMCGNLLIIHSSIFHVSCLITSSNHLLQNLHAFIYNTQYTSG